MPGKTNLVGTSIATTAPQLWRWHNANDNPANPSGGCSGGGLLGRPSAGECSQPSESSWAKAYEIQPANCGLDRTYAAIDSLALAQNTLSSAAPHVDCGALPSRKL